MRFEEARPLLDGVPYIRPPQARELYEFILSSGSTDILELGFAHGTSTCYMAAALEERGSGAVVTIDLLPTRALAPSLETLLERTGLSRFVRPIRTPVSYTWELMKMLERSTVDGACQPQFDFAFIDGSHLWETDGLAFFLVDKLLRPGGWVLFDDLGWRLSDDPHMTALAAVQALPQEMRDTPQVGRIFELLVCQHPSYGEVRVDEAWGGIWGWARKNSSQPRPHQTSSAAVQRLRKAQRRRETLVWLWRRAQSVLRRR